ncbi:MAG TPA: hypothetical protein VEP90_25145, partial [Methylomirabilota bacterium]|nr:hypothetical protein [Methylomirabilota bacterium]
MSRSIFDRVGEFIRLLGKTQRKSPNIDSHRHWKRCSGFDRGVKKERLDKLTWIDHEKPVQANSYSVL